MYQRTLEKELKYLSSQYPVITLTGPRQSGKTTLAQITFSNHRYTSLEDPDIREFAETDPRGFINQNPKGLIIDEIQRVPSLISYIQTVVDKEQVMGQFILTGSHQLALNQAITQSLAGRTALVTLLPLSFEEYSRDNLSTDECMIFGSMPGLFKNSMEHTRFFKNYFETYVTRDVRMMIKLQNLSSFEKFVKLCAGRAGQILNLSALASDIGVSSQCISEWLSILESSYIVFRMYPFYENINKRLIKSPKLYFNDVGLLCYLLGIETTTQLERDPLRGNIFENLAVLEFIKYYTNRGKTPNLSFYRDSHGREVDLLIPKGRHYYYAEIKSGSTFHNEFNKNLNTFSEVLKERAIKGSVIYAGNEERINNKYTLYSFKNIYKFLNNIESDITPQTSIKD